MSDVRVESRDDGVLTITLVRPHVHNALTPEMLDELQARWESAVLNDSRVKAVLVSGEGPSFSAGHDLNGPQPQPEDIPNLQRRVHRLVYSTIRTEKPVIAALRGHVIGIGLALALAADITVAATDARLLDGQVPVGVTSGEISSLVWPLLCGMAKAKYYLLSGEAMTGSEAERIGLVSFARPSSEVYGLASDIAKQLAAGSQRAIGQTKQSITHHILRSAPAFEFSTALEMLGFHGPDAEEARAAFREKRPPDFGSSRGTKNGGT